MSGESYDNCQSEPIDTMIFGGYALDSMKRMAEDLSRAGAEDVAVALRGIVLRIEMIGRQVEEIEQLRNAIYWPMKTFNYWKSADSTEDSFRRALTDWRAG